MILSSCGNRGGEQMCAAPDPLRCATHKDFPDHHPSFDAQVRSAAIDWREGRDVSVYSSKVLVVLIETLRDWGRSWQQQAGKAEKTLVELVDRDFAPEQLVNDLMGDPGFVAGQRALQTAGITKVKVDPGPENP